MVHERTANTSALGNKEAKADFGKDGFMRIVWAGMRNQAVSL